MSFELDTLAVKKWFSDFQKKCVALDLFCTGYGTETQDNEEGTNVNIEKFLGEMLVVEHGKQSVFFVRFFPFKFCSNYIFFLRFILALSTGRQFQDTTLTN